MYQCSDVTVAIPTFGRDQVLVDTVRACLDDPQPPGELIVVDQTPQHEQETTDILQVWHDSERIRWERRTIASQPAAMNHALVCASCPLVLFLDDDIVPTPGFIAAHAAAHSQESIWVVVGQIIQPWQVPSDVLPPPSLDALRADFDFPFHSTTRRELRNVMSGHMSVLVERALQLGGFDENFRGAAYRFDTEFGRRVLNSGGRILFEPSASIRHLRATRGGTRSQGNHLASASPIHGVGDYYFALLPWLAFRRVTVHVPADDSRSMYPVPSTTSLVYSDQADWRGKALLWAWQLRNQGPALIRPISTIEPQIPCHQSRP